MVVVGVVVVVVVVVEVVVVAEKKSKTMGLYLFLERMCYYATQQI